jgi:NitT/TauT family transport system substrate-binding protein
MKVMSYLDYMNRAGLVTAKAASWKDIYFPGIHNANGS